MLRFGRKTTQLVPGRPVLGAHRDNRGDSRARRIADTDIDPAQRGRAAKAMITSAPILEGLDARESLPPTFAEASVGGPRLMSCDESVLYPR
jgi:hypothetical protein